MMRHKLEILALSNLFVKPENSCCCNDMPHSLLKLTFAFFSMVSSLTTRNVKSCVGEVPQENVESDFFVVDVKQGNVHITLMAYETVYVPFSMLSLR